MSVNKFIGVGNITRNAEVRQVGQSVVAKFGLAMSEKFRKQDGSVGENTEFIDVELWNQSGVTQYLLKGQQVYVEGSLRTETWEGQDGQQRRTTKIRANSVQLLGQRPQAQQAPAQPAFQPGQVPSFVPQQPRPQPQPQAYQQYPAYAQPQTGPARIPQYAPAPAPQEAPMPEYQPLFNNEDDLP